MKDVNAVLKEKLKFIFDATGYEGYSNYAPHNATDNYYLLSDIGDSETSTMNSTDTQLIFQIGIFTKKNIGQSGNTADAMAEALFLYLYPDGGKGQIDLSPDFAVCRIVKTNDVTQVLEINSALCINRILTFRIQNIVH